MIKNIVKTIIDFKATRTENKIIIFLSDDWGATRIRSKKDQKVLLKKGVKIKNRFDEYDSIETDKDLELLFEVLTKHKNTYGKSPIFTAVTNVGNPDFERIRKNNFEHYHYETISKTYQRYPRSDNVLNLMKRGRQLGFFDNQLHGREHIQYHWWMNELQNPHSMARSCFEHEFTALNSDYIAPKLNGLSMGAAFNIYDRNEINQHKHTLRDSVEIYRALFKKQPASFTPPAVYYHRSLHDTIDDLRIKWLDVPRYFKMPIGRGWSVPKFNYHGKKNRGRKFSFLVRNCVFEPNMAPDSDGVDRCLSMMEKAFKSKIPAIISNHRAAFVGRLSEKNRDKGLQALDRLLNEIFRQWPDAEFVTVDEL